MGCVCGSCERSGNSETGRFLLDARDLSSFAGGDEVTRVGVGMTRALKISDNEKPLLQSSVNLTGAALDPADMADVRVEPLPDSPLLGNRVILLSGKKAGKGHLTVETVQGDTDRFLVEVVEIEGLSLSACARDAVYLRGTSARISVRPSGAMGPFPGVFATTPIATSPEGAADLAFIEEGRRGNLWRVTLGDDAPERVSVSPDGYDGDELTLPVHDPSTIEDLVLTYSSPLLQKDRDFLRVGKRIDLDLEIKTAHGPACLEHDIELRSLTPDVCKVRGDLDDRGSKAHHEASTAAFAIPQDGFRSTSYDGLSVKLLATGTCTVTARATVNGVAVESSEQGQFSARISSKKTKRRR
jgi:hypothetical protein